MRIETQDRQRPGDPVRRRRRKSTERDYRWSGVGVSYAELAFGRLPSPQGRATGQEMARHRAAQGRRPALCACRIDQLGPTSYRLVTEETSRANRALYRRRGDVEVDRQILGDGPVDLVIMRKERPVAREHHVAKESSL